MDDGEGGAKLDGGAEVGFGPADGGLAQRIVELRQIELASVGKVNRVEPDTGVLEASTKITQHRRVIEGTLRDGANDLDGGDGGVVERVDVRGGEDAREDAGRDGEREGAG